MRRATIEIRWEGPDKAVRDFISEKLDALFEDMTYEVPKVTFADASTRFESKIPATTNGRPRGAGNG